MNFAFVSQILIRPGASLATHLPTNTSRRRTGVSRNTIRCTQTLKPPSTVQAQSTSTRKPRAKPRTAAEGDSVETQPYQKALMSALLGSACLLALKVVSLIGSPQEAFANVAALTLSYLFADFAVGVYHHAVDNYGSERTPVFGYQIAAFQGHHSYPWTITSRGVANNLHKLTYPTLPQLFLLMALPLPSVVISFYASFLCFIVMSQETHRQAHMIRAAPWVRFLQDAGLILSQKSHAGHHRAPPGGAFEGNYCILSGMWNDVLDSTKFFRSLEALVFRITGTEPICWKLDTRLKEEALGMLPNWLRFFPSAVTFIMPETEAVKPTRLDVSKH